MKSLSRACVLLLPLGALAQADDLQAELNKCASIGDIKARVACYDGLARPTTDKPSASAPAPVRLAPAPALAAAPVEKPAESLVSKVTSVREVQPNKLQITLENGQVWQQTVGKSFLLRPEDTVRIAGSGWGRSFRLTIEGHPGFIQVSRVQ